jgi:hypothetical protein
VVRIPIHSCPWSTDNCPTHCWLTNPYTPHISSYYINIDDINNASRPRQAHLVRTFCICLNHPSLSSKRVKRAEILGFCSNYLHSSTPQARATNWLSNCTQLGRLRECHMQQAPPPTCRAQHPSPQLIMSSWGQQCRSQLEGLASSI